MSEMEWNSLSKTEKMAARKEEAKLREQRQIRYAIERQNRLKEDRITSDNKLSSSTAQAASAAASAAQSASQSASAAQQASENTSTNNITFNPNIVVSNTNNNDLTNVSSQDQSNDQTQANSNDSNANNSGSASANNSGSADNNNNGTCKQYEHFIEKGDEFVEEEKFHQAVQMYEKAIQFACTDAQKEVAQEKLASAQEDLENNTSGNNGGN